MTESAGPPVSLVVTLDAEGLDALAERVALRVVERLAQGTGGAGADAWLGTREAAEHLGIHPDTLRRAARERAIPFEQDGPGRKLYFRRSELDRWRANGGHPGWLRAL